MKPLKLLVVSHSCTESVNRTVYRILAKKHGVPIHLVVPSENDVGERHVPCQPFVSEPFSHSVLKPVGYYLRLRRFKGLRKVIEQENPSHILLESDPSALIVTEVLWCTRSTGVKVWTLTNENLSHHYIQDVFKNLFMGRIKGTFKNMLIGFFWLLNKSFVDRVFTISSDGKKAMEDLGFKGRVQQIPLGFDSELFFPQPSQVIRKTREKLGLKLPTIAYFGRINRAKGIHCLIEALEKIKQYQWQLLIDTFAPSSDAYVDEIKSKIKKAGLEHRIITFHSNHQDMPAYMNAADIVVLASIAQPNWIEQYGRVVPEAMACGKLVIVSTSGTPKELVGDAGWVFPEGDATILAEKLVTLLHSSESEKERVRKAAVKRAALLNADSQAIQFYNLLNLDGGIDEQTNLAQAFSKAR